MPYSTPLPAPVTNDHRSRDLAQPHTWLVATDKVMSGWGLAPGKSYVAYPVYGHEDRKAGTEWMEDRNDFIRVRENMTLPRLRKGDHLSIYDRGWVDQPYIVKSIHTVEIVENRRYHYIFVVDDGVRGYDTFFLVNESPERDGLVKLDGVPENAQAADWMEVPSYVRRFVVAAHECRLFNR